MTNEQTMPETIGLLTKQESNVCKRKQAKSFTQGIQSWTSQNHAPKATFPGTKNRGKGTYKKYSESFLKREFNCGQRI